MGVSVTIVQRPKQLLAPLDADMASFVHAEMRRHGVALGLVFVAASLSTSGWKPPCRTSTLWATP